MACPGLHCKVTSREERDCGAGVLLLLGSSVRYLELQGFTLSWQFKNIKATIKGWEGKSRVTQVVSYLGHQGFLKVVVGLSSCVAISVCIQDGSLEWIP